MTDADNVDDLVLLANTPAQTKLLLHSLEQAAKDISFYVNANETEFMHFKWKVAISALGDRPLKLADKLTYLGSNITSAEINANIHPAKVWTAINRLSIIWKSDLSKKRIQDLFQVMFVAILLYRCIINNKMLEKKQDRNFTRML